MLDGLARRIIDPSLNAAGRALASAGVTANGVTWGAFACGMAAAAAIALGALWLGLALLLLGRIGDGLDGSVARASGTGATDFGGFLDISLDFAFYGAIPLAFAVLDPEANAIAACTLVLTFYVNGGTVLAFAVMAEKRAAKGEAVSRGDKSLLFTTGLAEGTETIGVFVLMCLFPSAFAVIAYLFAAVCAVTAGARIALAARVF
ncbi:MAG: CDP-alcohol phosphatidyltransferase family protein [Pseudomonadota bacterium]